MTEISKIFENSPGKKVLMSVNEAFARGIFESGVRFAANYPGTPLSEVGDILKYHSETTEDFTFEDFNAYHLRYCDQHRLGWHFLRAYHVTSSLPFYSGSVPVRPL